MFNHVKNTFAELAIYNKERKLIKKWSDYGYMEGGKNKRNLAYAYEFLDNIFSKDERGVYSHYVKNYSFIAIRRIFDRFEEDINVEIIETKVYEILFEYCKLPIITQEIFEQEKNRGVDIDAEACAVFSDYYHW